MTDLLNIIKDIPSNWKVWYHYNYENSAEISYRHKRKSLRVDVVYFPKIDYPKNNITVALRKNGGNKEILARKHTESARYANIVAKQLMKQN